MNKPISKKPRRIKLSDEPKELLLELFTMAIAFAITPVRFLFDIYPFGLALCASSKKRSPFALAGSALSFVLFVDNPIPYVIALLALVGMRLVGSVWLHDNGERELSLGKASRPSFVSLIFMEKPSVRVALCALCAFGLGAYRVIASGYSYYEIFVLIFFCVFASVLCYALCSLHDSKGQGRLLGICALLFIFIYSIRGREIFGLDISMVLSYASVLYASKYLSGAKSTALGALLGICHGVLFAPVFAICALVSSILWSLSYYLAIISALVMSVGYGVFASGYQALVYLLPELLLASLAMYPVTRFELLPRSELLFGEPEKAPSQGGTLENHTRATIIEASRAFKDISELLSELSQKSKAPDREFFKNASLEICEKHCFSCPKRSICWERDTITTKDNISRMGEQTFLEGAPGADGIDERFLHRCPNIELIFEELSALKRSIEDNASTQDKLEVSAQDYDLMSRLIDDVLVSLDNELRPSSVLSDKARRVCDKLGLKYGSLEVVGAQSIKITIHEVNSEASKCSLSELKEALEKALEMPLGEASISEVGSVGEITISSAPALGVESAKSVLSASEGEQNGDTLCEFSTQNDKFYALLCDGMGSGRDAYMTSELCAELMRRLLPICKSKELSMCMLNNLIRAKGLECSSSVDLLEIDLISGSACLVKSGAAPSFIKRGSNVFRLHSRTAPIGIMKELDAEKLDFNLREGDVVIMISDGIASDERDSKYLVDFLSCVELVESDESVDEPLNGAKKEVLTAVNSSKSSNAEPSSTPKSAPKLTLARLPEAIISLAREKNAIHRDDMSVSVIKVTSAIA